MTPMEGFYCFCENIRTLRRVHLLSTREMADIMGINVNTARQIVSAVIIKKRTRHAKGGLFYLIRSCQRIGTRATCSDEA